MVSPVAWLLPQLLMDQFDLVGLILIQRLGDRFDKRKAFTIALGRAENGWGPKTKVPVSTVKVLNKMYTRATSYYKNVPVFGV